MSKNIFINNLDTYVSQAIFKELRNDQPDPETGEAPESSNNIFGTFIGKDSSLKPEGIKKMLKVSERAFSSATTVTALALTFKLLETYLACFCRDQNRTWQKATSRSVT